MLSKVHFISGLPRSGSTLLAAILRQNPRFHAAGMTTPVAPLCLAMAQTIGGTGEFSAQFDDSLRARMLRAVVDAFYADSPEGAVVFDTNRTWTARTALLAMLYPQCKVICCVREIGWILDSFEKLRIKNPLRFSKIYPLKDADSIYARVASLMHSEDGIVGCAWAMLREAWYSDGASRLIVIPYERLTKEPQATLQKLYQALDEPYYPHDFNNVHFEARDYDANIGMPGLHTLRPTVEYQARRPIIPPDLFEKYSASHFWMNPPAPAGTVEIL